jgi:uncharacterized glyoxalase superfamily protein PhnB
MADAPISNYRTVTPYLVVNDAERQMEFLKNAFGGAEALCSRDAENRIMHALVTIGDSLVMLGQGNDQYKPRQASLYLWVDDVDATYERALRAGATSDAPPEDKFYGHRNSGVTDPNGNQWWISAPVKRR